MNCCDQCKRWRGYREDDKDIDVAYCDDVSCPCHKDKGEKYETDCNERKCQKCDFCIKNDIKFAGMGRPTPTTSWEERFDERFNVPFWKETGYNLNYVKDFIRHEIQAAEERGIDIGGKTQGGTGRFMYEKDRQDLLETIERGLPPEDTSSAYTAASGFNAYRTAVLTLLASLKK